MQLHDIQTGIIIAHASMHEQVRIELLKGSTYKMGIKLLDLHTLIYEKQELSKEELIFKMYVKLKTLNETLRYFKDRVLEYPFIKQLIAFIDDYYFYEFQLEGLPQSNNYEKELITIISSLLELPHPYKEIKRIKERIAMTSYPQVYILPQCFTYEEQQFIDLLIERGATRIEVPLYTNQVEMHSYVNASQEIEALVQTLSQKTSFTDICIGIPNTEYQELLKQYLERYQIPYSFNRYSSKETLSYHYKHLLQYYYDPSEESIFMILQNNPFHIYHTNALIEVLDRFHCSFHDDLGYLKHVTFNDEYFHSYDQKRTLALVDKALQAKAQYLEYFERISASTSNEALFNCINALILEKNPNLHFVQEQSIKKIQRLLVESVGYCSKETFPILGALLDEIQRSEQTTTGGVYISDYFDSTLGYQEYYIVGGTQKNYPGFQVKKGIFDERYYKDLPYPSMSTRFEHHLLQLDQRIQRYPFVHVSFPLSTYEGKTLEGAMELEALKTNESTTLFPIRTLGSTTIDSQINHDIASFLYVDHQKIKASISSLELYSSCPLQYFLKYGLRIKEPIQQAFQSSTIGSLIHKLFERCLTKYQEHYTEIEDQELLQYINEEIDSLEAIYPYLHPEFYFLRQRLFALMKENFGFLKGFEMENQLKDYALEYSFDNEYPLSNGYTLQFKGFIDRLNQSRDRFMIIDYKSSAHKIDINKFMAGRQLQLLTYSVMLEELMDKKCIGAYYYNFRPKRLSSEAYKKINRGTEVQSLMDSSLLELQFIQASMFEGINFLDEASLLDAQGFYIKGISKKDQSFTKVYGMKEMKAALQQVYTKIIDDVMSGIIHPRVSEKCDYCHFQGICRQNTKDPVKMKPIIDLDVNTLLVKGAKTNDEVES